MSTTTKPRRFLLFIYDSYYPGGGWSDLYGSYDTFEEARDARVDADTGDHGWITDLETGAEASVSRDGTVQAD